MTLKLNYHMLAFAIFALASYTGFSQSFIGHGSGNGAFAFKNEYRAGDLDFLTIRAVDQEATIGVKGSPYTTAKFIPATVLPYNMVLPARYNEVKDQMEVEYQNQILILDKKRSDFILKFHLGNKTYKLLETLDEKEGKGYLQVLSENEKVSFYKKAITKYFAAKAAFHASVSDAPAQYRELKDQYYIGKDGQIERVVIKKKAILKMFPEKQKEIKAFIKTNKIKFSNETSVVKLIKYINTLY
jgi:hypothetical protein